MGTLYRLSSVFADLLFNLIRILHPGAQINHTKNDCFKTSKAFEPCCKGTVNQPTNVGCFGQTGWNERTIDEKYLKKYGSCWCFSSCRHIRLVLMVLSALIPLMEVVAATVTLGAHCPFPAHNMNKSVLSLSDLPSAAKAEPQLASLKSPCTVTGSQASLESKFKSPTNYF